MEHYTNINAMVQAADLTLPPPEKEPDRQYYFIKNCSSILRRKSRKKGENSHAILKHLDVR